MSSEKEKLSRFDKEQFNKHLKAWQAKQSKVKGCKITLEDIIVDLADRLNVSDETVKNWKKGYNKPKDYNTVISLAEALEISPEELEKKNDEKDMVINMAENNVVNNSIVEGNTSATETETATKQFKLMNDMFDLMKKHQEINDTDKNAVLSVYHDISYFLETYRSLEYGTGNDILSDKFDVMYRKFRKLRLEIPKIVYDTLEKFMTEYLLMMIGIDTALPLYLKEADSRMHDIIEFSSTVSELTTSVDRTKMTKELWKEYLNLREYIISKSSFSVKYNDCVDELFCTYEFEEYSEASNYVIAAIFVSDLYAWIHNMWYLKYETLNWYIDNTNLYKTTCLKDAYRHLDEILSAYIP